MTRRLPLVIVLAVVLGAALYYAFSTRAGDLVLTGIVTTDDVIVSSEVQGRLQELLAKEGDTVKRGQILARIQPQEWKADVAFYADSERQSAAQVAEAEANLRFEEEQTNNQIRQAEANLAAAQAQVAQAVADAENARLTFEREEAMYRKGVEAAQAFDQARTAHAAATAHVDALRKQQQAAEAAVALAKGNADRIAARRATLEANVQQLAAMGAQKEKAQVHLDYTEIHAPIDGVVDVRAALQGEVVPPGRAIVTLIDPDDLWVRADVEESYIDSVHLGDTMTVRLPSGAERLCTVFYRGVDADYATQRDVSRTKRDIKTFEIRLRCDNADRSLAVGMTAYVVLPLGADHGRPAAAS
ncbi:MAG TPA: efflux RND transporter periplasmic adaptor subunit [Candidatus Dormibacteraeota bacterium]|nr:efflux RND transporter periplasmic adaptor subunit [Candidatus Dormibacteraeota bacterium]